MSTQSSEWIAAARVLRRVGFGASGVDVDSTVAVGDAATYVDKLLSNDFQRDRGVLATPMPDLVTPQFVGKKTSEEAYNRYNEQLSEQRQELTYWWLRRMAAAENPAREKLTLIWHNHFATGGTKVRIARLMAQQNEKLRHLCLGDFRTLALSMLTDAAMIAWLDGRENIARSPNENLAREFMELFTLGHGAGYSEMDVREGARALTGWTILRNGVAELQSEHHDQSKKTVLGITGNLDAAGFCDAVLAQKSSPRFVAGRLWQQLASDAPPSRTTIERLLRAYGPDRDLHALTRAILTDDSFLRNRSTVVVSPVEWLVGLLRAIGVTLEGPDLVKSAVKTLKSLGQVPLFPADVGGWPRGGAWLSTSSSVIRLRAASRFVGHGDISIVAESHADDRIDAVGFLIGVGTWSDRTANALKPLRHNPDSLVAAAVNTPEYLTS